MASARPSRRPGSTARTLAVAATAVLALAGCSATNPITTSMAYNVVDGVQANLSDRLAGHNLLILAAEEGAPGVMSGALLNHTADDVQYTVQVEGGQSVRITVPARGTVLLGEDGEEVRIDSVPAPPGAAVAVTLSTPEAGSVEVEVPVFDDTLPQYQDVVPDPGTDES